MTSVTITGISVNIARDTDAIGKMDPYIVFKCRHQHVRTSTAKNAGTHASWPSEQLVLQCEPTDTIIVEIYDDDVGRDDKVGTTQIAVALIQQHGGRYTANIPFSSSKNSGQVIATFILAGGYNPYH